MSFDLTTELDGTTGFTIEGPNASNFGFTVVGAGDVNADGFADIFGTYTGDAGAWVIFGHPEPWDPLFNASVDLNGTNGFHISSGAFEYWGWSGGAAGDVNGDGVDDLIVGGRNAVNSAGTSSGAVAIFFGHSGAWPAELDPADAVGNMGFLVDGSSSGSCFGGSARGAGDVNGDGLDDFVVGAENFNSNTGHAVLVFGVDDHCAVCSNASDECLKCDDGFFPNGAVCSFASPFAFSSSSPSPSSAEDEEEAVVVIETGGGGSASDVAAEIAQLLGVDVGQISVVEITPGTFEVTVINEEVAQQLVTLVEQCMQEEAGSDQQS